MAKSLSIKHIQISKSQTVMVLAAASAAFMLVFAVVSGKALVDQIAYNNKVINGKKTAVNQLLKNTQEADQLISSYKAFVGTTKNVLGGNPQGTGQRDGDNARIVLNALPSKYDFPALTTSVEKLLLGQKLQIASITGSDDEVTQSNQQSSPKPSVIEIPFEMSATGTYGAVQSAVDVFGKSIRPFRIQTMQLSGGQTSMTMNMTAVTYYQPARNFDLTKKVVR